MNLVFNCAKCDVKVRGEVWLLDFSTWKALVTLARAISMEWWAWSVREQLKTVTKDNWLEEKYYCHKSRSNRCKEGVKRKKCFSTPKIKVSHTVQNYQERAKIWCGNIAVIKVLMWYQEPIPILCIGTGILIAGMILEDMSTMEKVAPCGYGTI